MAIFIKNREQIELMRAAARIVRDTHKMLEGCVKPGVTTQELDKMADEFIRSRDAVPSFQGYRGFPAAICVSINEEVIHGIPGKKKLCEGDICSIDIGTVYKGYHGDAARTYKVGVVKDAHRKLTEATERCFFEGMRFATAGRHLREVSEAVQQYVESEGFTVVREYVGHGIGSVMHEEPQIPNYRTQTRGPRLAKNMTLAFEPMVNEGACDIKVLNDGFTVVTKDGMYSAHYENTVLITDGEPDILTL